MFSTYTIDDLLAAGMGIIGLFAFYEAYTEFGFEEGVFPMIASGIIVTSVALWIVRDYLPPFLYSSLIEYDERNDLEELIDDEELVDDSETDGDEETPVMYHLIGFSIGYVILAYLIGFLWATPFFIAAYGKYRDFSPVSYLIVGAISFIVVLGFVIFTAVPLDEGIIGGLNV